MAVDNPRMTSRLIASFKESHRRGVKGIKGEGGN